MKKVHCWLRERGYRVDNGFASAVDDRDEAKTMKVLQDHLHKEIRARGRDPKADGHRFELEVRRDNGDHLMNVRVSS